VTRSLEKKKGSTQEPGPRRKGTEGDQKQALGHELVFWFCGCGFLVLLGGGCGLGFGVGGFFFCLGSVGPAAKKRAMHQQGEEKREMHLLNCGRGKKNLLITGIVQRKKRCRTVRGTEGIPEP